MRKISILGSTGSIGTQALDVVSAFPSRFRVVGLAAKDELSSIEEQIKKFSPKLVSVIDEKTAEALIERLKKTTTTVYFGKEGLLKVATSGDAETVVVAIPGMLPLIPTLEAIDRGADIALASKEILVAAGSIIMERAKKSKVKIIPIDSEHSAISQCLKGEDIKKVKRVILTASGGPFLNTPLPDFPKITAAKALSHPVWKMGPKISIDSATLMNKGFEVIEAHHLFNLSCSQIEVVIHPQSIIHSMVEFLDGSIIAQLSAPDMRLPIQYALLGEERVENTWNRIDFTKILSLTFSKPDKERFPCLDFAYEALRRGGTLPAVLNAADEEAVKAFLSGKIKFTEIGIKIREVMDKHEIIDNPTLPDILAADRWARTKIS